MAPAAALDDARSAAQRTVHLRGGTIGFEALSPEGAPGGGSGVRTPSEGDFFHVAHTDS